MKTKSKVLRTKNRIFFLITVIVFTGFENARAQRADSSIFINVTSFDDHVMHIVWDRIADGNIFTLEKSTDGISFYTLSVVNEDSVENITEIFTQVTKKYNKIFYSTEGDNKRFIYNDDDAHQRGLVYRVKIIKNDFSIVFTRNEHEYKEQQSRAAFQSAVNNLRIPIPCPPVGVPPIGSTATGNYQTTTVNCCAVTLQEYVFLACASIGINCAPGNGDCIAACNCTWDPCCVHTCAYYFSCSCPPWPSCGFNSPQLPQWIVVSVAPAVTLTISSNSPTTVCAGNSIVILSANANGAPPFTYNWSNAATTSSIQVSTSSPGNFIYTVTITDANGCTNSATRTIIVNPLPVVMVSPNASICFGQNTVLSSSGANSYFWSPSTGLSTITGNSVTANPVSTTTYTVVGNVNGCTASAQVTVTVNPLPVVTVSPSPAICNGQTTTLTASGANTFIWSPSATLSSSTGTSVSANPVSTTTYTVTGNWSGCTATAQVTVTVNLLPVVTVSPSPTICNGQTTTLTANGANTFIWSPSATLSSSTGASVSANPVSTTTYIVTGNLNGCTATAQVTVTVNPLPVVTVSPSPTICFGQTITLNAGGANTYIWSPSLSLSSSTGASVSANPLSTTTYIVTGDLNGCTATAQVTVTVNPLPVVTVSPPPTICNGQTTTLTASGANTYSWSPSATLSSSTGASVSANPLSTTTYTVTGDLNGCTASAQVTVTVTPLPIITVSPSPTICIGYTIALAAGGANTYTWSPSATLSSSTGASVSASPLATTTYTVTGDLNGCTATAQVTVTVVQLPAVTASLASTICIGQSITLIASGANTYMWSPSATLSSSTGASVSANPLFTTTYTVTGDLNGCTATA
ncbi:MAG: hypothetical protein JJE25_02905, partial [Bacteroidia bacterium]|nr:hypothetical protein [Bacteroidia bacterium]